MESNDKISIVLPCYKAERCIANMIRDIQAQTYTNWELIVVSNGGGQESQLKIIREFEEHDRRIQCYSIDEAGPGPARNFGIEKATGTWIAFVDADDDVKSDWLSRYLPMMAKKPDIICAGYQQNFWMRDELVPCNLGCREVDMNRILVAPEKFIPIAIDVENILAPVWNKLYSATFLKIANVRFDSYTIFEDNIFNYSIVAKAKSMCFIPDCGYLYNVAFIGGVSMRYCENYDECGRKRMSVREEALATAGTPIDEKSRVLAFSRHSFMVLINTFKMNSPHGFSSRFHIVKEQFSKSWMKQVGELYKQCQPAFLESLFYKFYRLNAPTMCVLTFSAMHWVRRNMKGVSAILLRHLG